MIAIQVGSELKVVNIHNIHIIRAIWRQKCKQCCEPVGMHLLVAGAEQAGRSKRLHHYEIAKKSTEGDVTLCIYIQMCAEIYQGVFRFYKGF